MRKTALFIAIAASMAAAAPAHAATITLSASEKANLVYLIEEEKLARDVYNFLAATVTSRKFANIAQSEQTHMNLVASLLKTYGITDPTKNEPVGVFKNATLASLYAQLTTSGSASYLAAMQAGVSIETLDIADLKQDIRETSRADIRTVMNALLRASQNHLAAFSR